jgi:hypothetical protein
MSDTIFGRIAAGEIPADIVYENDGPGRLPGPQSPGADPHPDHPAQADPHP